MRVTSRKGRLCLELNNIEDNCHYDSVIHDGTITLFVYMDMETAAGIKEQIFQELFDNDVRRIV